MVSENTVLSDFEHMQYADNAAQKISVYYEYLSILEKWFSEAGWELPLPCRTNFRDAWFHFKKLYERKDYVKVVQEEYALEEHLIRAVKDAIICYYQIYIRRIEIVYQFFRTGNLTDCILQEHLKDIKRNAEFITVHTDNWTMELYKRLEEPVNMDIFMETVCYVYCRDMDLKQVAEQLQSCLHKIKNYYSKLRLNGTDIYRPVSEEEYMNECEQVFIQMMDCLKDNGLEDAIHVLAKAIITGKKSTGNNHQI